MIFQLGKEDSIIHKLFSENIYIPEEKKNKLCNKIQIPLHSYVKEYR